MKTALVLGGADCVWQDAATTLDMFDPHYVVAANDIGAAWSGRVDAWCTLHPEKMAAWRSVRAQRGLLAAGEHVSHEMIAGDIDRITDYRWPGMEASGSSGLFAVKVALEAGADRVVLAGIPMTMSGAHFFSGAPWVERDSFHGAWTQAFAFIQGSVRSMSGWTQELLGAPTPQWLAGDPPA